VKIISNENFSSCSTLSYRISGRDSFKGRRSVTHHFSVDQIKTLVKCFILGKLKTSAKLCAWVLVYMILCMCVHDFRWMCVCDLWHDF
jgi:hypothetical protein